MTAATINIGEMMVNIHISKKLAAFTEALDASDLQPLGKTTKARWYFGIANESKVVEMLTGFFGEDAVEIIEERSNVSDRQQSQTKAARTEQILRIRNSDGKRKARKF